MQPKRKAANPETTEERLTAARAELARIEAAIVDAGRDRDLALLDEDADAVRRPETATVVLEKDRERAARRIALLEDKAASELRERQD
ncbi:MAG: hypothetical protein ACREDL_12745, partial [Bradyrhizobium sp.]